MWIVSRLNAFALIFLAGLFVGFALGLHAVRADIGPYALGALALVALIGSWRDDKRHSAKAEEPPHAPLPPPRAAPTTHTNSAAIEDAQAALTSLGYGVREARNAITAALANLDDDADASAIVRAALRARGR